MSYRDDVDALRARHAALEAQVTEKRSERDHVRRLIDEAVRLPVLDNVEIASPCGADWNAMTGDDRVRHCGSCDKQVFNISAMTRDEATALVRDNAGQVCLRYYQRADGTILLADCTIGRRRRRLGIAGSALLAAGAGVAVAVHVAPDEPSLLVFDEPLHEDARRTLIDIPPPDLVTDPERPRFELGGHFMGASRALEFTPSDVVGPTEYPPELQGEK